MSYWLTRQQILEKVVLGLRNQLCISYDKEADLNLYRYNGCKCAVGFLIEDKFYTSDLEGKSVPIPWNPYWRRNNLNSRCEDGLVGEALIKSGIHPDDFEFVSELADVHDYSPSMYDGNELVEYWSKQWLELLKIYKLKMP